MHIHIRVETNANGDVVHAGSLLELASLFYPPIEELAADKPEKEGVDEEELVEEEIGKAESEKVWSKRILPRFCILRKIYHGVSQTELQATRILAWISRNRKPDEIYQPDATRYKQTINKGGSVHIIGPSLFKEQEGQKEKEPATPRHRAKQPKEPQTGEHLPTMQKVETTEI